MIRPGRTAADVAAHLSKATDDAMKRLAPLPKLPVPQDMLKRVS